MVEHLAAKVRVEVAKLAHRVNSADFALLLQLELVLGQSGGEGLQLKIGLLQLVLVVPVLPLVRLDLVANVHLQLVVLGGKLLNSNLSIALLLLPDRDLLVVFELELLHLVNLASQLLLESFLASVDHGQFRLGSNQLVSGCDLAVVQTVCRNLLSAL